MGTNTFHLMVVEWHNRAYEIVLRERQAVRIGVGGINQNRITPEGIERAVEAIRFFKTKIDQWEVANVFAIGTSALRNANNREEVITKIREATGIETKVISG